MRLDQADFTILGFIIERKLQPGDKLPSLQMISKEAGISVSKVREALEVARMLGFVEIKPGRGTIVKPFQFADAVKVSSYYAIKQDEAVFFQLRDLRNSLEIAFWEEATENLNDGDISDLRSYISSAFTLLEKKPIQIPVSEHRNFHLKVFSRLDNVFVYGILEAFWDAYNELGLSLYQDLKYHRTVWSYHDRMVDSIEVRDSSKGRELLIQHMALIQTRVSDDGKPDTVKLSSIFE